MSNDQQKTFYFEDNAVRLLEEGEKQLYNFYKKHHITCIANAP